MVAFIGYGGACPDYSVGDAHIVNRLSVSCFCLAVTITETGFVTLTVTEILKKYTSAGGN